MALILNVLASPDELLNSIGQNRTAALVWKFLFCVGVELIYGVAP
jgi:hypothetical protein